jgi:MoxR-like ATPase
MNATIAPQPDLVTEADVELLRQVPACYRQLADALGRRIVGQDEVIRDLFVALAVQGHVLMIGVPGLAKTLLIRSLAELLDLPFQRIQFMPDLMPSDITGTEILEESEDGHRHFRFVRGPVFASLILADEINRTPPKTQAALLEAMQERRVTVAGHSYDLPSPFFVMATQNPIEQEGTYPLPEAQLDRFMFNLRVNYPSPADEVQILLMTTGDELAPLEKIWTGEELLALQSRGASGARSGNGRALRRRTRAIHPAGRRHGAGLYQALRAMGRRPARVAISRAGGKSLCRARRPVQRCPRRHPARRQTCPAPPHHHQLSRRGRPTNRGRAH